MSITLQQLFREHFPSFAQRYGVSRDMAYAAWCVTHCRTAELGGHVNSCPEGHFHSIAYNSCRHRSCPQCGFLEKQRWLETTSSRLLSVPHHHLVFTVASEFTELWQHNRKAFSDLLFACVHETLTELLSDPKYLGGRFGMLAALHTWNQRLQPHVHLHCVVTAGGLGPNQKWIHPKKSCLLPRKVLMIKFRGKFKAMLRKAIDSGKLAVAPKMDLQTAFEKASRKAWNVKIHSAYRHAQGVVKYLAGYLKSGPIKNTRLLSADSQKVVFKYRLPTGAGGDGKRQGVTHLPIDAFLVNWLQHVPPRRFQVIRGYGLYSANQHSRLDEARKALGIDQAKDASTGSSWQELCERGGANQASRCPTCGRSLVSHDEFQAGRGPPLSAFGFRVNTVAA